MRSSTLCESARWMQRLSRCLGYIFLISITAPTVTSAQTTTVPEHELDAILAAVMRGEETTAAELQRAIETAEASPDPYLLTRAAMMRGAMARVQGSPDQALRAYDSVDRILPAEIGEVSRWMASHLAIEMLLDERRFAEALPRLHSAVDQVAGWPTTSGWLEAQDLELFLMAYGLSLGETTLGPFSELLEDLLTHWIEPFSRLQWARALTALGQSSTAEQHLEAAIQSIDRLSFQIDHPLECEVLQQLLHSPGTGPYRLQLEARSQEVCRGATATQSSAPGAWRLEIRQGHRFYRETNWQASARAYVRALDLANGPIEHGMTEALLGLLANRRGQTASSIVHYGRAQELFVRADDAIGIAWSHWLFAEVDFIDGDLEAAIERLRQGVRRLETLTPEALMNSRSLQLVVLAVGVPLEMVEGEMLDPFRKLLLQALRTRIRFDLASLLTLLGRTAESLEILSAASAENLPMMAQMLLNLRGEMHLAEGDLEVALQHFDRALRSAPSFASSEETLRAYNGRGLALLLQGDLSGSILALAQAQRLGNAPPEPAGAMRPFAVFSASSRSRIITRLYQYQAYIELGRISPARRAGVTAWQLAAQQGDRVLQLGARQSLCRLGFAPLEYERAREHCEQAVALARQLDSPPSELVNLISLAWLAFHREDLGEARRRAVQALDLSHRLTDRLGGAQMQLLLGLVEIKEGRHPEAHRRLAAAQEVFDAVGAETLQIVGSMYRGFLEKAEGNVDRAIEILEAAAARVERLQHGFRGASSMSGFHGELPRAIATALAWLHIQRGDPARAFEVIERARTRTLLQRLQEGNRGFDHLDGDRRREGLRLRGRLRGAEQALEQWRRHNRGKIESTLEQARLFDRLRQARHAYSAFLDEVAATRPPELLARSVSLPQLQAMLPPDSAMLVYFVEQGRTLTWTIRREGFTAGELPLGEDQARTAIHTFRLSMLSDAEGAASPHTLGLAEELYDHWIRPLKGIHQATTWILVPHGPLHELPFAALRDAGQRRWLIEDHSLILTPSASVYASQYQKSELPPGGTPLVVGPADNRLPAATEEAHRVARKLGTEALVGRAASETAVRQRLATSPIVHLAVHGNSLQEDPLYSRLRFGAGHPHDGRLEIHEVLGLDLGRVQLLVLSACGTSLGERTRGDAVQSLAHAFLSAGAHTVVTSLWRVEDPSTAALMERFYLHLDHLPIAEALRRAQRDLIERGDAASNPRGWAAFGLLGRGDRHVPGALARNPGTRAVSNNSETSTFEARERLQSSPLDKP